MALIKRLLFIPLFLLLIGVYFAPKAHAASLIDVSDTITTSRPSSAATLSANLIGGSVVTSAVIGDKGDMFLASDSALIYPDIGETFERLTVASQSASGVPIVSQKLVYFTTAVANSHHIGDALIVPITATHTIQFSVASGIPNGGHIIITFPTVSNIASPSATGFSFNGLAIGNVKCYPTTACGGAGQSVTGNTITLTTTSAITAVGGPVYIAIGCNGAMSSGICPAGNAAPVLINPTVSSTQCAGQTCTAGATNDVWKITIQTTDASNGYLDYGRAQVATIESVQVQAQVEPTLTFSITGMNDATNFTTGASTCGSESTNSGIAATATSVNFGIVSPAITDRVGQKMTVTTNQAFGYDLLATSSGSLINPGSGIAFPDANGGPLTSNTAPAPAAITAGATAFGISPCGNDVAGSGISWGPTGTIAAGTALLANPWNLPGKSYEMPLAIYSGGPSNGLDGAGNHGVTVVRYGAAVSSTWASGIYITTLTYMAVPSF